MKNNSSHAIIEPLTLPQIETDSLFENLPELIRPAVAANVLNLSTWTIYDWKYRQKQRGVPSNLFVKINRNLYIRTSVLKRWIASQNPMIWD